jgi:hypothetical protein
VRDGQFDFLIVWIGYAHDFDPCQFVIWWPQVFGMGYCVCTDRWRIDWQDCNTHISARRLAKPIIDEQLEC